MKLSRQLEQNMEDAALDALHETCRDVVRQAIENMPPGDPRLDPDPNVSLADSVRIERDGNGFVVIVDTPYAAKVHEDLHMKHPRGGGPKYLERAVTQEIPQVEGVVASKVQARLARGLRAST